MIKHIICGKTDSPDMQPATTKGLYPNDYLLTGQLLGSFNLVRRRFTSGECCNHDIMKPILLTSLLTVIISFSSRGQGYVNLNFENANIVFVSGLLATSNALPGWSAYSGTNQLSTILYNESFGVPTPTVGLYGSNSLVISGNFSVTIGRNGSISQTGLVPNGSESLLFAAPAS